MSGLALRTRDYTVAAGDSLWKIAQRELGDATRWPEIAQLNASKLPGLVLVGQRLRIPEARNATLASISAARRIASREILREAIGVACPAFEFTVNREIVFANHPAGRVTFSLKGKLIFQQEGSLGAFSVENLKTIESQFKVKYENELARLAHDIQFKVNPEKRKLEFSSGLTHTVKFKGKDWMSYSIRILPGTVIFEMKPSPVEGRSNGIQIKGELGYEVKIEENDRRQTQPSLVLVTQPAWYHFSIPWREIIIVIVVAVVCALAAEVVLASLATAAVGALALMPFALLL